MAIATMPESYSHELPRIWLAKWEAQNVKHDMHFGRSGLLRPDEIVVAAIHADVVAGGLALALLTDIAADNLNEPGVATSGMYRTWDGSSSLAPVIDWPAAGSSVSALLHRLGIPDETTHKGCNSTFHTAAGHASKNQLPLAIAAGNQCRFAAPLLPSAATLRRDCGPTRRSCLPLSVQFETCRDFPQTHGTTTTMGLSRMPASWLPSEPKERRRNLVDLPTTMKSAQWRRAVRRSS
jgi:hypothetical protein